MSAALQVSVPPNRVVVVGAGQAGGEFVAALRLTGYSGEIAVIGEERHLPYSRPPLSKAFLSGEADEDALLLHGAEAYAAQGITTHIGHAVTQIDRTGHRIEVAGAWLEYDKLVLATGGKPRQLPDPALAEARNVLTLRTLDDASALRQRLTAGTRLAIVGGGYIGLEIAAAARKAGADVTVLEAADRVLARVTAPVMSEFFQTVHAEEGVKIIVNAQIDRFELNIQGDVAALHLKSGEVIPADCVLVGIGLIPRTELAESSGLATDNGILVDRYLQTSDPDIFAIGDAARHPDPQHGGLRRLESVPNATEQARIVAAAITGSAREYDALPWFWSDQFDCKLQVAGLSTGHDTLIVRRDPAFPRRITTLYLREGILISADVVNSPAEFVAAKKLIASGATVGTGVLADPAVPLRAALTPAVQHA